MSAPVVEWALAYAAAGIPVFPVHRDKRPACVNGFKDAVTDAAQIRRWWKGSPRLMVGVPTAGFLVVDLDVAAGDPQASWRSWCELAEPHGWEPTATLMSATPSDGLHVWFRAPAGVDLRNSAGRLARHVDVRANGGYCIVPPSVRAAGRYEWLNPSTAIAEAPGWLVTACAEPRTDVAVRVAPSSGPGGSAYGLRALESECGRLAIAPVGGRNDALFVASCRLGQLVAGEQLDAYYVADMLLSVAQRIGLGTREAQATIRSGIKSGQRSPRVPTARAMPA